LTHKNPVKPLIHTIKTGTTIKVVKKTYWKTYALFGTDWKIVWVKTHLERKPEHKKEIKKDLLLKNCSSSPPSADLS